MAKQPVNKTKFPSDKELLEAARLTGGKTGVAQHFGYFSDSALRRHLKANPKLSQKFEEAVAEYREAERQRAIAKREVERVKAAAEAKSQAEKPGKTENEDGTVVLVSAPRDHGPLTVEDLAETHGLDLDEWVVVTATPNAWNAMTSDKATGDNRIVTMHQLKVTLARKSGSIQLPDPSAWKPLPKPKPRKRGKDEPLKGVAISDHHCPHYEPGFHNTFVQRLRDRQPDLIEVNGDLLDFPDISKHRSRDEYNQSVNECLAAGYKILRDYRDACPDARIVLKRGNHDERLDLFQIDNAPQIRSIAPGGGYGPDGEKDERPWHDLRRLLHLDHLHVEYINEPWEQAKTKPSKYLTLRHGFSTSENAGKMMLEKLSGSTIQGHDHRLAMTFKTRHEEEELEVRLAMSGGCACKIPGGLGYVKGGEPNWQNGAVEFLIWPDDTFHVTPIVYVNKKLFTPDKRYEVVEEEEA